MKAPSNISTSREAQDLEILMGRRGPSGKRAVRLEELTTQLGSIRNLVAGVQEDLRVSGTSALKAKVVDLNREMYNIQTTVVGFVAQYTDQIDSLQDQIRNQMRFHTASAVINGRSYWISAMLRVRESRLRAQNDRCCAGKKQSGRRVSGGTTPLPILLFMHEGLKSTNRLSSDVHLLS